MTALANSAATVVHLPLSHTNFRSNLRRPYSLHLPPSVTVTWNSLYHSTASSRLTAVPSWNPLSGGNTADETKSTLKSRLRNGETLYGMFLLSFSPTIAEIAALSGYDYLVVDMEHGPGGITESLNCIRAAASYGIPSIIRVPETSAAWAKKALDIGPAGLMFPMIESAEDAKAAVSYSRFPPAGVRGSAHPVVRASRYGLNEGYLRNYEEELLVMCQVETVKGVESAAEIAAVAGVDSVQMGPLDLSASMGHLSDPGNENVREMLRLAETRVLASGGVFLGGFAMPHDPPSDLRSRGYKIVSGAVDVGLFRAAAVEDVRRFKTGR